jgi:mono/diheme cytochrome c family protein
MRWSACAISVVALLVGCREREAAPVARQKAEQIWKARCVECHGPGGRGDGPKAAQLRKKPRDFTDRAWQDREDDEELAKVIVGGGAAEGYGDEMPANPDLASQPAVVSELVKIVRSRAP